MSLDHNRLIAALSEGYRHVDNGSNLYRRVLSEDGRTLCYLHPRGRYYQNHVRVVWASPIEDAPLNARVYFGFTTDANGRETTTIRLGSYGLWLESRHFTELRVLIAWADANPVNRARANRPRGPRVGLFGSASGNGNGAVTAANIFAKGERRIGLEMEFFGVSRSRAEEILRNSVPNARAHGWKIVSDGSVTRWQGHVGLELVTPPLGGSQERYAAIGNPSGYIALEDGWAQLATVLRALRAEGARVDTTCGVHVHIEAIDVGFAGVKRFITLWAKNQDHINLMLPQSRRNNSRGYVRRWDSNALERLNRQPRANADSSRYYVVNQAAWAKFKTVEVRQLAGTLQLSKIQNWVELSLGLFDIAAHAPRGAAAREEALKARPALIPLLADANISDDAREALEDRAVDFGANHDALYGAGARLA